MKRKQILLWSVVSVAVIGVAVGAFLWLRQPQTIVLGDGTKLTLVGVTYGKNHTSPKAGTARRTTKFETQADSVCVWIRQEHKANAWPSYQLFAYDKAATACVGTWTRAQSSVRRGDEVVGFAFEAFPRRERKIYLRLAQWGQNGQEIPKGEFVVANPARGKSYPKWQPQSLPIKQSDGDLDVALTRLDFDPHAFFYGNNDQDQKNDPRNCGVLTAFHIEQNGNTVTNWQPVQVDTSDATGNRIRNNSSSNQRERDEPVFVYQWGLWPDEPAWKLRVEFSRTSGFNSDESWNASEIPIEKGNVNTRWQRDPKALAVGETTLSGSTVKVFPVKKFPAEQVRGWGMDAELQIVVDPPVEDARLTVFKITDDQGHDVRFYNSGSRTGEYHFGIRQLGDTKSVNVTLALHRSRFVEFTVKPPKK